MTPRPSNIRDLPRIDDVLMCQVADAIRWCRARQMNVAGEDAMVDWKQLTNAQRLQWLELAYAAVSAWVVAK